MHTLPNRYLGVVRYAPENETGSALENSEPGATGDQVGDESGTSEGNEPESILYPDEKATDEASKSEGDEAVSDSDTDETAETDPGDVVPEDGKYTFELAEGMVLDQALADKASPLLKDAGITQKQANVLAGIIGEQRRETAEAFSKTQEDWVKSIKADKEIGGGGFERSVDTARKALDRFGTPELREYLAHSGGGNHPEIIRFMARVGGAFSEDKPAEGGTAAPTKTHAEILYGKT